jgi:ATP-dependent exoDNAse (exonuclease V) beta subunit
VADETSVDFEARMRQRVLVEQRRAVLEALRDDIDDARTVGEVYDAAHALGWSGPLADLSLADLAAVLLADDEDALRDDEVAAANEAQADDDDDDVDDVEATQIPKAKRSAKKSAAKKTAAKKSAAKKTSAKKASAKKTSAKKASAKKTAAKKTAKKAAADKTPAKRASANRSRKKIVIDERMSLDEAIEVFVPLVEGFGEATMQDLEDATGAGRRKLRFHIGQLVRHGHLDRHGMGRGTYYTVA